MLSNNPSTRTYHLHTIAISVANLEHSIAWYVKNLGFRLMQRRDFQESQILTAMLGGVGFQVELIQNAHSMPLAHFLADPSQPTLIQGFKKIVIQTRELDALYGSFQEQDVTFVYPDIQDTPGVWGQWFMIEDLDGNILQFIGA
jgi:catechol 2,3-dioxygenase-like lactoylglutathione lyase family enzyme